MNQVPPETSLPQGTGLRTPFVMYRLEQELLHGTHNLVSSETLQDVPSSGKTKLWCVRFKGTGTLTKKHPFEIIRLFQVGTDAESGRRGWSGGGRDEYPERNKEVYVQVRVKTRDVNVNGGECRRYGLCRRWSVLTDDSKLN